MMSRSLEHGTRRAEEMREAARTVAEAGVPPHPQRRHRSPPGLGRPLQGRDVRRPRRHARRHQ
ncbi:DUF1932 domain-containing protein [Phenylobacterium sp. J367]|uniref:DUF1932 domain-containing protein n=1 Tax=Phenylobacterium sp. J367 TaxID=2898435 RepID=UPI0035B0CCAA